MEPRLLRFSLALAVGSLGLAGCYTQPPPPTGNDGGAGPCVETQLCIIGDHWDSSLCKCVPDQDAGTGVACGTTTCAPGQICCSPSCGICGSAGGVCPQIACALQWYTTCGDPVCRGYTGTSGVPLCTAAQKAGAPCTNAGEVCDPQDPCNALLRCTDTDPKLGVGGCPISSRQYKKDIQYVDSAGLKQLAKQAEHVRLARYRYKDDLSARQHLGFIIEDQPGSPAVERDRNRVDLYGYTSMAVAALQVQQKQIQALQQQVASLQQELASAHGGGDMCSPTPSQ